MKKYTVIKKGSEWALYCNTSRTIIAYGQKKKLEARAAKLNRS